LYFVGKCCVIPQGTYRITRPCRLQQRYLVIVETELLGLCLRLIGQSGNPLGTACIGFTDTDLARSRAATALRPAGDPLIELAGSLISFTGPLCVLLYQFYPRGNVLGSLQRGQLGTVKILSNLNHPRVPVTALHL